jgi:MuDR family transposase
MDDAWMPNGLDSETTFNIDVKIEGFLNKQNDGKKIYVKGKILKWRVDSDRFSLCDMVSDLSGEITWGSCQKPKIWMFDKKEGRDVEIIYESQILEMFNMYQKERKILLYVVVCDSDGSSKCSNTTPNCACTPSQPTPSVALDDETQMKSSQRVNDNECNEYVGVNEEDMYGFDDDEGNVHEDVDIDIEEGDVHKESAIDDEVDSGPIIAYDPENPKIELNALFLDVDVFRKALRHYPIKNEFEVSTLKSDKKRFIGKCKYPNCPWRIHASRLQDSTTFMV